MKRFRSVTYALSAALVVALASLASGQDPAAPAPAPAAGAPLIGDVIAAKKQADAQANQAQEAARAANEALAGSLQAQTDAAAQLRADLALTGPVLVPVAGGQDAYEVWIPDTSDVGYHVIRPVAVTTPVPQVQQPPAPAPQPDVNQPQPTPQQPAPAGAPKVRPFRGGMMRAPMRKAG